MTPSPKFPVPSARNHSLIQQPFPEHFLCAKILLHPGDTGDNFQLGQTFLRIIPYMCNHKSTEVL